MKLIQTRFVPILVCLCVDLAAAEENNPPASPPTTTEKITAGLPKYSPPAPPEAETGPAIAASNNNDNNSADASEPEDQPRNRIIRLPAYDVRQKPLPIFRDRELLTDKGRIDLAYKRHPGLKFDPLGFLRLNDRVALAMATEEEQSQRNAEMFDLLDFLAFASSLTAESRTGGDAEVVRPAAE